MQIVSAAEAVAGIRSGEQLYVHSAAATPSVLLDALVARAHELADVKILHFHIEGPGPHLAPEMASHFRHRALFIGPNARAAVNEGRAIIALPSTAGDGTISRIVPFLRQGAGVVTTRAHVQTIITEYGVAEMHGRSIPERARQLIAIAHPDHRAGLQDEARRAHFI
jgi:acyl-CoA hydrolase